MVRFFIYIRYMNRWNIILFLLFFGFTTLAQETFSVYFDSNKHNLNQTENKSLTDWIEKNKTSKILSIHGFTDEDGTNQYNDSLSTKRVDNVYKSITGKIKIREDFKKISFGENFTQSAKKAENRKVIIYYLLQKDLAKEEAILAQKATGFVLSKKEISFPDIIKITNFNGTVSEYKLNVEFMKQVSYAKKGEKLKIENLNFVLNTFAVTNDSRGKLYELLLVMQKNPNLKIQIQGHVCCVTNDKQNLSTQRAKAVKMFLEQNNIESTRMSFIGFGSTQPLFPLPEVDEEQRAANRRVEIEIIEN